MVVHVKELICESTENYIEKGRFVIQWLSEDLKIVFFNSLGVNK